MAQFEVIVKQLESELELAVHLQVPGCLEGLEHLTLHPLAWLAKINQTS